MTIRLYLDEDSMRRSLVRALRARGVDVITALAGMILRPQQRYSVGEQMRRLLKLIASTSADAMRTRIEFLSAWR